MLGRLLHDRGAGGLLYTPRNPGYDGGWRSRLPGPRDLGALFGTEHLAAFLELLSASSPFSTYSPNSLKGPLT